MSKKTSPQNTSNGETFYASLDQMIEDLGYEVPPATLVSLVLNAVWRSFTKRGLHRKVLLAFLLNYSQQLAEMEAYTEQ